jgi:hypothetical protein
VDKQIRAKGHEGGHRSILKPVMAEVYNTYMGGVDLLDQKIATYAYQHKVSKWYHSLYHRLRDISMENAYIIYQKTRQPGDKVLSARSFCMKVIDGLLDNFTRRESKRGRPSVETDADRRLKERHFPGIYADPKYKPDCHVCSNIPGVTRRKQTRYHCQPCNKPLCVTPCFELYHTQKNFRAAAASHFQ